MATVNLTQSELLVLMYALADAHSGRCRDSSAAAVTRERGMRWQDIADKLMAAVEPGGTTEGTSDG